MIHWNCPSCAKPLRAKDAGAGKRVRCPSCSQSMPVPALDASEFDAELIEGFEAVPAARVPVTRPMGGEFVFEDADPVPTVQMKKAGLDETPRSTAIPLILSASTLITFLLMAIVGIGAFGYYKWAGLEQKKSNAIALAPATEKPAVIDSELNSTLQKIEEQRQLNKIKREKRNREEEQEQIKLQAKQEAAKSQPLQPKKEFSIQDRLSDGRDACRQKRFELARTNFALGVVQCSDGDPAKLAMKAEFCLRLFLVTNDQEWHTDYVLNMRAAGLGKTMFKKRAEIIADHKAISN